MPVVHIYQSKARVVPIRPFKVVHQAPCKVSAQIDVIRCNRLAQLIYMATASKQHKMFTSDCKTSIDARVNERWNCLKIHNRAIPNGYRYGDKTMNGVLLRSSYSEGEGGINSCEQTQQSKSPLNIPSLCPSGKKRNICPCYPPPP